MAHPEGRLSAPPTQEVLSPTQQRALEERIYRTVLGRVVRTVLVGVVATALVIALVGWLSWSAVRRRLLEGAVATFQTDDSLRGRLWAGFDTTGYGRLLESVDELEAFTRDRQGAASGGGDADELRRMLEQMLGELEAGSAEPRARIR